MANTEPVRARQPKSRTKATILATAHRMYLDRELEPGSERLAEVLDRLGYTSGAGYQIWANQAEFRRDLQVYIAAEVAYGGACAIGEWSAELVARNLPFEQFVLTAGDLYIEQLVRRTEFSVTLRFFGLGPARPPEVTEALVGGYQRLTTEYTGMFLPALRHFGRRMRPGVDVEHLVVASTALAEGYALRELVSPADDGQATVERQGHHRFSVAFLVLVEGMTETVLTAGSSE